jgi:hypothetical protein
MRTFAPPHVFFQHIILHNLIKMRRELSLGTSLPAGRSITADDSLTLVANARIRIYNIFFVWLKIEAKTTHSWDDLYTCKIPELSEGPEAY